MQDFPANSHKAKATAAPPAPREQVAPVTSAKAVERKQGLGRRFKETFFGGTGREAASHVVEDVVVPAIRDMFHDALMSGIDRLIYGERTGRPRSSSAPWSGYSAPTVNYQGFSKPNTQPRTLSRPAQARHDFRELVIPTAQEANEVLDQMFELLSRHGSVNVADLYALTDVRSSHTDLKWGWTNLRGSRAERRRNGGYILRLPEPEALG